MFTDERTKLIEKLYVAGETIAAVDLNSDIMLVINLDRASLNWDYSYTYTLCGV